MLSLFWLPVVLQVLVPLVLLTLLAMGRERSEAAWLLTAISVGFYLCAVAIAGMWLLLPWYTPVMYGMIFIAALVFSLRRAGTRGPWPRSMTGWSVFAARAVVCTLMLWLAAYAVSGRRAPEPVVELEFPLRQGNYLVVNGGSNTLLNAHFEMTAPRFHAYRGSANGVDIVRVNSLGFRVRAPTE